MTRDLPPSPSFRLVLLAIVILLLIYGTLANPLPQNEPLKPDEPPDCTIEGDEGLYGIGVRTGIYLQVFAAMFTLAFQRKQGPSFLYAAAALQAALFVALVYASSQKSIYAAEGLVAILLLIVMALFEILIFASMFIHLLSGHIHLAHTSVAEHKNGAPITQEDEVSKSMKSTSSDALERLPTSRSIRPSSVAEGVASSSSSSQEEPKLTRQRTRVLLEPTELAKLNISEALIASDPLLISGDNLDMLARVVESYTDTHAWASAGLIFLLILGSYIYMMWFWWDGMYHLKEGACSPRGFFFVATFGIQHWIRWIIRVVLVLAGLVLLSMLYQFVAGLIALSAVLMFQFLNHTTDRLQRNFSAIQRMKHFYDTVSGLDLSPATEYLLLVLVFRSFVSHYPDRLAMALFPKKKEARTARSLSGSDEARSKCSTKNADDTSSITLPTGLKVPTSDFFVLPQPLTWGVSICNTLCVSLLRPQPSLRLIQREETSQEDAETEKSEFRTFILPYADNFATITLPCLTLLAHAFYFALIGVLLAAGIWSVELTISRNHIGEVSNLTSAAQLIPFIIGAGSFVQSGLSGFAVVGAGIWAVVKVRRETTGSKTWFDAIVSNFFYEADEIEGSERAAVDVEYFRHFPLMLVIWMLFPAMRKGQAVDEFKEEFHQEMDERGGFFALDLLD